MDIAHMLVDEMRRNKVSADVVTYNVLIGGYRRLGDLDRVNDLFKEMTKEGIVPDDFIFTALGLDAAAAKAGYEAEKMI